MSPSGVGQSLTEDVCENAENSELPLTQDALACAEVVQTPERGDCETDPIAINGVIDVDTTIGGCYESDGFTVEPGATLTIEAGTTVHFLNPSASGHINGTIDAQGTEAEPIWFYGGDTSASWGGGLRLRENSTGNIFDHVIFENGGGFDWNTSVADKAMLVVGEDSTQVEIKNSMFRGSGGNGIHVTANKADMTLDTVSFDDNTDGAILARANNMGGLANNLGFGEGEVVLVGGGDVTDAQTWSSCVPWQVTSQIVLKEGGDVKIEAGSTLAMNSNAHMIVDGGTLNAVGEADRAILFTGVQQQAGSWGGINFSQETVSDQNVLDNVIIEYAGGFDWNTAAVKNTSISLQNDTVRLAIRNTIIRNSSALGLYVNSPENDLTIENVHFIDNAEGAADVPPNHLGDFTDSSSYASGQSVIITGGSLTRDNTASKCVPYQVVGDMDVDSNTTLTVEPGATLEFGKDVGFQLFGQLEAVGTEDAPITFTGVATVPGSWGGMRLRDTSKASFDWVLLESGGGIDWNTSSSKEANLNIADSTVDISIHNTTLVNSAGGGVYFSADPSVNCYNVLILDEPAAFGVFDSMEDACDEGIVGQRL